MGLFNFLDVILDPVFGPLLKIHPFMALFIITFVISLVLSLIYKYTTDQEELKKIREKQKKLQKKQKEIEHEDPEKAMKLTKELISLSGTQMKHSLNSMLYTFLPIIILFGWLGAHLAYYPIMPGQEFNITVELKNEVSRAEFLESSELELLSNSTFETPSGSISWLLKGEEGLQTANIQVGNKVFTKEILISEDLGPSVFPVRSSKSHFSHFLYGPREKTLDNDAPIKAIVVSNEKIKPLKGVPLIGNWGWFGAYFFLSLIIFSGVRKLLKVY